MVVSCGDGNHITQAARNIGFATRIGAPGNDPAVGLERQTVVSAGGNCDHIRQFAGKIALAGVVDTPVDNSARGPLRGCNGEDGYLAGHGAVGIGDEHSVVPGVGGLHIGERKGSGGCAGEIRAVEAPLVRQRLGAERRDGESGRRTNEIRPALWLHGDRGSNARMVNCQRRDLRRHRRTAHTAD